MISFVIPVYNEEENVKPLYGAIQEVMNDIAQDYEVIFVDDGSTDKTLTNLTSILNNGNGNSVLRIIELQQNYGQTPALLAGFANVKGDIVVSLDGDMQNDPHDVPQMLDALTDGFDVICGWRKNRRDNIFKKLPSKLNNFINRKLNNVFIHDSGCTLRIYRKEAVKDIQLFAEGHRYIPAVLANQGFKLGEVVTNHKPRTRGNTKYGFKRLFRGFIDLFALGMINKWGKKPSHLFTFSSFLFFISSFLLGLWTLFERVLFHRVWDYYPDPVIIKTNPLLFISIGLSLFGILLLFLGFITEILVRQTTDSHNSYSIKREWSKENL
ncbi:MAG: glycosyltransferase family 2 protein [Asgard group archaeon]|nr:glycosyltransferase family 2 protein [Asgard group archaeon]